jgi:2-dehydro-3-deoxyphosphogluconate aldolase/(4S)-4-hydroxy-2-oxoglutarate aldolase
MALTAADITNRLAKSRLVPVVVLKDAAGAEPLAEALLRAGLDVIEITFRTAAGAEAIKRIAAKYPQMLVGAGTLLDTEQVQRAKDMGATFGVAPGLNQAVVEKANAIGLPFMPGIMTPSELEQALGLGCKAVKFFPAMPAGGPAMVKGMLGAYRHTGIRFMPTGGVDRKNMTDWLAIPEVVAVGGSWMVEPALLDKGDWAEVEKRSREAVEATAALAAAAK